MRSHFNCRLIAAALMLIGTNAFATPVTISFEEIGKIVGGSGTLAHPGVINGVDFGTLGIFDTVAANLGRMSVSSPNAGFLERAAEYPISLANHGLFTFISADVARDLVDASFFRFTGSRNGHQVFSEDVAFVSFPDPQHIVVGSEQQIDTLAVLWGPVADHIASLDNFTFEASVVPVPGALALTVSGLIAFARFSTSRRPDQRRGRRLT